jgi:hypothetical protein
MLLVQLTQVMMPERLSYVSELACTVLEVKVSLECCMLRYRTVAFPLSMMTLEPESLTGGFRKTESAGDETFQFLIRPAEMIHARAIERKRSVVVCVLIIPSPV